MLTVCQITVKEIEVDLKNKPQALINISPKGTVPVLVTSSGTVIEESMDIVKWAVTQEYPSDWATLSDNDILLGEKLITLLHDTFIPSLNRYKYATRYENVNLGEEEEVICAYLQKLNNQLESSYLLGGKPSLYDVAIFPFVRQLNIANDELLKSPDFTRLHQWFQQWLVHPAYKIVMLKKSQR
jgi:glutathione S-transferase